MYYWIILLTLPRSLVFLLDVVVVVEGDEVGGVVVASAGNISES
jgi:hypothetical protein